MGFHPLILTEPLEPRRLLSSIVILDKILTITGNNGQHNRIMVKLSYDDSEVVVHLNSKVRRININNTNLDGVQLIGGNLSDYLAIINNRNPFTIRSTLIGGGGDDTLIGGDGHNLMIGGNGDSVMIGGTQDDTMVGGRGNDTITGGDGGDLIFGSEGNDVLTGGINGRNIIFGGSGNDTINGVGGTDELFGDSGNDRIIANSGDTIYSGSGNDTVTGSVGASGEFHKGEYPHLSTILAKINPDVKRFRAAGGIPADTAPLI